MSVLSIAANPLARIAKNPQLLRQFSVVDYHKMIESGILTANDRVELLEGWIVNKMPQNTPHVSSVRRVMRFLCGLLSANWTLTCQGPISLADSEPEPDFTIARGEQGIYDRQRIKAADIGVLMEVGDCTLLADRRYKGALYAQAKIPDFWLINVVKRQVEVYTKPRAGKYQKVVANSEKQSVPLVLDGEKIADIPVSELIAKS